MVSIVLEFCLGVRWAETSTTVAAVFFLSGQCLLTTKTRRWRHVGSDVTSSREEQQRWVTEAKGKTGQWTSQ